MAFQIKNFASIAASLINYMKGTSTKVTDFNVGSVARTLVEAPAAEIEELYLQMFNGLREAIPVSLYNSMDFYALEAVAASNLVRVVVSSSTQPLAIPSGTVFSTPGRKIAYASVSDVTVAAGNTYVDVQVAAQVAGVAGNIPAGLTFALLPSPAGFVSASNLTAFVNGIDAESENDRKSRFNDYIKSLPRGTVAALGYGLRTTALYDANGNETERVKSAAVIEPYLTDSNQPVALVNCFVHNGVGSTSGALVAFAKKVIDGYYNAQGVAVPGWKAAGVNVTVAAAPETLINFAGVLTVNASYVRADVVTLATAAVAGYIRDLPIGVSALRAEMVAAVMNIDGVTNIVMSAPAADVTASASTKLMPGTITFS
jgi:uncharacterized phage protein gp47/JayE